MIFLGQVIGPEAVSADPQRIAAILSYPAPRNQKQLRQFLGTCGIHHKFVINYADFVAPLSPMLKKGVKWKWRAHLQQAFEELRTQFSTSIHVIHPNDELPYSIYMMHLHSQSVLFSCRLTKMEKRILLPLHPEFCLLLNKSTQHVNKSF